MYSCHNTAVFIRVARATRGLQVPTLRWPQDGRKWSAGKFKDMSVHQREEAQNGGCSPESVLQYLEIWLRHPSSIYVAFSRGLGVKNITSTLSMFYSILSTVLCARTSSVRAHNFHLQ